jgi:tetraacyldisaccharide-1-P 4'-kinase
MYTIPSKYLSGCLVLLTTSKDFVNLRGKNCQSKVKIPIQEIKQ